MAKKKQRIEAPEGYHVELRYLEMHHLYTAAVIRQGATVWETKTHHDPTKVIAPAWERLLEIADEDVINQRRTDKALRTVNETLEAHGL